MICSAISSHWQIFIYLTLVTACLSFLAHGSQDLYPIFLTHQLHFSDSLASISLTLVYCCAFGGGIVGGHCSTFFGRRLTMIVLLITGGALIPAYVLPKDATIIIGASYRANMYRCRPWYITDISLRTCTEYSSARLLLVLHMKSAISLPHPHRR